MNLEEGVYMLEHGNKCHTVKMSFATAVAQWVRAFTPHSENWTGVRFPAATDLSC